MKISTGIIAFLAGLAAMSHAAAQTPVSPAPDAQLAASRASAMGLTTYRLWPGRAPMATSDSLFEVPTLTVFRPQPGTDNGTAVIVAPGGAYMGLATMLEGRPVADWFTSRGITAFVLTYRTGPKARLPIPLLDGERAVRYVRANAARFRVQPDRIGMIGFSAGGHLTASIAAEPKAGKPDAEDPIERAGSEVNFAVLAYPWLEGMTVGKDGKSQYCDFALKDCNPKDYAGFRPVTKVTAKFPPTFIYHTTEDSLVRPEGSIAFYQALVAKAVPVEMHIFAKGQHGTGLGGADPALSRWPELLDGWLRGQGLLTRPKP